MKAKRVFDWSKYHQRQIALRIAYIGWNLKGFVSQQTTNDTVESILFSALDRARLIKSREECHYSLCGRTDAGVSAIGNVVSLRVRSVCPKGLGVDINANETAVNKEEELNYMQILNGILPETIRITQQAYVPLEFNARYDCQKRCYRYFYHLFNKDIEKMKEAANFLIGEHDFRGFCKFSPENTSHCVRRIDSIEFGEVTNGIWYFEITGSGFIWHQIRCIASVLFMVGEGSEEPTITRDLLDIKRFPGRPEYPIASPEPLVFWKAEYDNVEWQEPQTECLDMIIKAMSPQLVTLELRAAVIRSLIDKPIPTSRGLHKKIVDLQQTKSVEELITEYESQKRVKM